MLPPLAVLNDLWPAGGNYTLGFVGLGRDGEVDTGGEWWGI